MALPKLTTPTYELEIPSTDEKIKYRPFLVKEEKILMMAMETKNEGDIVQAVKDIVSECTFNKLKLNTLSIICFSIGSEISIKPLDKLIDTPIGNLSLNLFKIFLSIALFGLGNESIFIPPPQGSCKSNISDPNPYWEITGVPCSKLSFDESHKSSSTQPEDKEPFLSPSVEKAIIEPISR